MKHVRLYLSFLAGAFLVRASAFALEPSLTIQDAIRNAWKNQAGLQSGEAMVEKARWEAEAMKDLRLPTLSASAGFMRTNEPMQAFGMKLDQARISQMDFMPDRLNHPDPILGAGAALTLSQPLYAGGRLDAARKAGAAMASAEASNQSFRRQQVALAVVQAYFGAQVAEQALRYAEDTLNQARETERFIQARAEQGLMLKSDQERAKAFRAQAEAGVAEARQRVASARSALALLVGDEVVAQSLVTSLGQDLPVVAEVDGSRADLQASRSYSRAAAENAVAARGTLKPEVGLNLTAGTARNAWNSGGNWTTASIGARWTFSLSDAKRAQAARAQSRAAEMSVKWQEAQARREIQEARGALLTAQAKIAFAKVALESSESVRAIRKARHREGLLPLVEVLDAESGLSGARTLLLGSELDERVSRAQLALALGQPIESVKE